MLYSTPSMYLCTVEWIPLSIIYARQRSQIYSVSCLSCNRRHLYHLPCAAVSSLIIDPSSQELMSCVKSKELFVRSHYPMLRRPAAYRIFNLLWTVSRITLVFVAGERVKVYWSKLSVIRVPEDADQLSQNVWDIFDHLFCHYRCPITSRTDYCTQFCAYS